MFTLRRAAVRVLSSSYTSLPIRSSRSLTTFSPSVLRASRPTFALPLQKRWASDEVTQSEPEADGAQKIEHDENALASAPMQEPVETESQAESISSGIDEHSVSTEQTEEGTVASALSSAAESVSTSAQSVRHTVGRAADAVGASPQFSRTMRGTPNPMDDATNTNLYVGNLFFDVSEENLQKKFSEFGQVKSTKIIFDGRGLSKGFGYVEYVDPKGAASAIENMNQQLFEGRRVNVQYTIKKNPRATGHGPSNPPSKTLFIGNMSFEMSDQDLNDLFREIRNVIDVRVAIDRRTGQPRGFAHADFVDVASAERACDQLQAKEVYGRQLRIDYSTSSATSARKQPTSYGQ